MNKDSVARESRETHRHRPMSRRMPVRIPTLLRRANVAVALVDRDGRVLDSNRALCEMLGYSREELGRKTLAEITEPRDVKEEVEPEMVRGAEREDHRLEQRFIRKDGALLWGQMTVSNIRGPGGECLMSMRIIDDISERKRLESERQRHLVDARRRAAESDRLLLAISHDLRNCITVVLGHTQLVDRALGAKGFTSHEFSIATIGATVWRMNLMIQDMVDCVRSDLNALELHCQPVDMDHRISTVLADVSKYLDVRRIRVSVEKTLPAVMADPDCLGRILVNLLSNALRCSAPNTVVELRASSSNEGVVIAIEDHGYGIKPEDLPYVFERFHPMADDSTRESCGVSLHISKMLVEAQGGRIWVVSEPGKGSVFRFTLPTVQQSGA